ncbi:sensor histidine kinase [Paenibacillus sp. GCM10023252]|uniref:cache domain-containing sensor histidine kinase n=1 Tax=Paenibacillus sp. GCM10023252 TaxID=3252649 RepID=UPI00361E0619
MNSLNNKRVMLLSIRSQIILMFFLVIVTPFGLFSYQSHLKSVDAISGVNANYAMDYLVQSRERIETRLAETNAMMHEAVGSEVIQSLMVRPYQDADDIRYFISEMLSYSYTQRLVTEALRIRIFPAEPDRYPEYLSTIDVNSNLADEEWFKEVRESGKPAWHLFIKEDNPILYAKPKLAWIKQFSGLYDNVPRGVISAEIAEESLQEDMAPPETVQGQKTYMIDNDGVILSHPVQSLIGSKHASEALMDEVTRRSEGSLRMELDGQMSLVTHVRLTAQPWTIIHTVPLAELTKPMDSLNTLTIGFVLVYLLCCILVVLYITLQFTNPIVKLVRSMRVMEQGQFLFQLPKLRRKDEIGWLYQGFERLSGRIEGLIGEAYESERTKKELELQVLSHQINPHFLYNTLESIRWKAEQQHMDEIAGMVESLGNMLRLSLNQGKELTSVGRELEHVKAYARIEAARLGKPLRILYFIDEGMLELPCLRLFLQPLVENAIHHGVRNQPEQGKILLSGKRDGNDMLFELSDNGEGMPEAVIRMLQDPNFVPDPSSRRGVGLFNVNERLKLYFGEAYALTILSKPGEGTRIMIRHPMVQDDEGHIPR